MNSPSFCLPEKNLYFSFTPGRYFSSIWSSFGSVKLASHSLCLCVCSCCRHQLSVRGCLLHLLSCYFFRSLVSIYFTMVCPVTKFPLTRSPRATVGGSLEVGGARGIPKVLEHMPRTLTSSLQHRHQMQHSFNLWAVLELMIVLPQPPECLGYGTCQRAGLTLGNS